MIRNPLAYNLSPPGWEDPPDDYVADIGPEDIEEPDDSEDWLECEPPLGYGVVNDEDAP